MLHPLLLASTLAATVPGQEPVELVVDLETAERPLSSWPGGTVPDPPVAFAGQQFFRAWSAGTGTELFSSDGSPSGSGLVVDVDPGTAGSNPTDLTVHQGELYFVAGDASHGRELWKTDGTAAGTTRLTDIAPGPLDGGVRELLSTGSRLFFVADGPAAGPELWHYDSALGGAAPVADLVPGPAGPDPRDLAVSLSGQEVFFTADLPGLGREVARVDVVSLALTLVADVRPGPLGSDPKNLRAVGTRMVFTARPNGGFTELWSTDGTPGGTTSIFAPGFAESGAPDLSEAASNAGLLYFPGSLSGLGRELLRTDGTAAGTVLAADVAVGFGDSDPAQLVRFGGEVFFAATHQGVTGRELYAVGPDPASLRLVADIHPAGPGDPVGVTSTAGGLYFFADDGVHGHEPWFSDGTTAGTAPLGDVVPGPEGSLPAFGQPFSFVLGPDAFGVLADGRALFAGIDGALGVELFAADGAAQTAGLVADLAPGSATLDSNPTNLKSVSGRSLLFSASTQDSGREPYLWTPESGAVLLADIEPGPGWSSPDDFASAWIGDREVLFFTASNATVGRELWTSDGTPEGTSMVREYIQGPTGLFSVGTPVALPDRLVFSAAYRLHWSDGTAAGTGDAGPIPEEPSDLTVLGDRVIFAAENANMDRELWATDGTLAGTSQLADLNPNKSSRPRSFVAVGDRLAFLADDGFSSFNTGLWVTDGTAAGTELVLPGGPDNSIQSTAGLEVIGDLVFFLVWNDGPQLWRSDLTTGGTFKLTDVGTSAGGNLHLGSSDGQLFTTVSAVAPDGSPLGTELFVADGTGSGANLVIDVSPGPGSSKPYKFRRVGGHVLFQPAVVFGGVTGIPSGLFVSDGTIDGTGLAYLPPPGDSPVGPGEPLDLAVSDYAVVGSDVLFSGTSPETVGRELFRARIDLAHAEVLAPSDSGLTLGATTPQLGSTLDVTIDGGPVGPSLLLLGAQSPLLSSSLVQPTSAVWLDVSTAFELAPIAATPWAGSFPIPSDPVLSGISLTLQVWTAGPTIFPMSTSNAALLHLGD